MVDFSSEMCCFDQRTGFAASFAGIVLCALLSVVGVVLPGWTVRETVGQTVYAGLFWTCSVNGTLSKSGCLVGNPFEDSGRLCVCVCVCLCVYACV